MSKSNLKLAETFEPQARTGVAFAPYAQSPLHAFGLSAQARRQNGECGVWMNELPLLGYVILRGDITDSTFANAVKGALGVALPRVPGTVVSFTHGLALWQGPDEWLLVCERNSRQDFIAGLEAALQGFHAQVVDNSGGLTMVYLTGEHQVTLLRHVGVYDFEAIEPGQVVSTVCQKATITVFRNDDKGLFLVFRRSFADYIWRLLSKAARPYGLGIVALEPKPTHPVLRLV